MPSVARINTGLLLARRNEGKARQGIDTSANPTSIPNFVYGRNEGKARQGIDTSKISFEMQLQSM